MGTPTALNVWVLASCMAGRDRCRNHFPQSRRNALQRCLDAGLVVIAHHELVLTDAGKTAIASLARPWHEGAPS